MAALQKFSGHAEADAFGAASNNYVHKKILNAADVDAGAEFAIE